MPSYKTPKHFPGIERLGPLGQALMEQLFPADQLPVPAVSIGPKAIPLDQPMKYMQNVIASTSDDMVKHTGDIAKDVEAYIGLPTRARDIINRGLDPSWMARGNEIMSGPIDEKRASSMIDYLAEMFLPNTLR